MKKKWLSLILAILLMPCISLFSACDDKESYELKNLSTDYTQLAEGLNYISVKNNLIEFDYSNEYLQQAFEMEPFVKIESFYNPLFTNAMNFAYGYVDILSKDSIKADADIRNDIKSDLDRMKISLTKMDASIDSLIDGVNAEISGGNGELTSKLCMINLSNVFHCYEDAIESALVLNEDMADLYYTYAISNSNPNYYDIKIADFDASEVILNVKSRQRLQVVNITRLFVEMNIDGAELANKFTGRYMDEIVFADLPAGYEEYKNDVFNVSLGIESSRAETINNITEYKEKLRSLAVELYNVQSVMNNDFDKFRLAIDEIEYVRVVDDANSTVREKACAGLIEEYNHLADEYNSVLAKLIGFIQSV